MKTMCPPGFVATDALGHKAIVMTTGRAHCFHDNMYITLILLL